MAELHDQTYATSQTASYPDISRYTKQVGAMCTPLEDHPHAIWLQLWGQATIPNSVHTRGVLKDHGP